MRDPWQSSATPPLWWDGGPGSEAHLHAWRARVGSGDGASRLFGSTSRAHGIRGLARRMSEPKDIDVFVAQDYWGDVVPVAPSVGSLHYLVRDPLAAQMTAERLLVQAHIEVVGTIRLALFEQLGIAEARACTGDLAMPAPVCVVAGAGAVRASSRTPRARTTGRCTGPDATRRPTRSPPCTANARAGRAGSAVVGKAGV